ncbi:hypothetical protein [Halomonas sp. C22]|uniref:hypothetical protein n=1 Tax=Halomonas sp. C22 TaxID=2580567 RepID=UPI00119D1470|nr:hypothetical protein [Halomonas sp. C22]
MTDQVKNFTLTPAKKLLAHLQKFTPTFSCPCCGLKAWGLHIMNIDPALVENKDGSVADLDVVTPRFISGASLIGVEMPGPLAALPVTCQHCGYIAFFDATIVNQDTDNGQP